MDTQNISKPKGLYSNWSASEKRNFILYTAGIMCYKFVLESMNACMNGIVLNRLPRADSPGIVWSNMQGLNLAAQVLGSLLIGPLVKRNHAGSVLAGAILCMAAVAAIVPILEGVTMGGIPGLAGSKDPAFWGTFSPYIIYGIYTGLGIFHGMVELMRRVIPSEIVGGDSVKLKEMDSTVHICYEVTGTIGAFLGYLWIGYFGWGYAFTLLPIGFTFAALCWRLIQPRPEKIIEHEQFRQEHKDESIGETLKIGFYSFFHSIFIGAKLVFSQRALIWLVPAYSLPLILHRYLENTLFPFFTKAFFGNSDLQNILTGGSNFGELCGAFTVLMLAAKVKTPIPFLRLDVFLLLIVWVLPYFPIPLDVSAKGQESVQVAVAWSLAPLMAMISFGWAAGDVSLAAYVQSRLGEYTAIDRYTTPLGAVMSFLYIIYLVGFYVLNLIMSSVRDNYVNMADGIKDPQAKRDKYIELFVLIGGVFMTVAGFITLVSTFIPRGAFAWNPDPDQLVFDDYIVMGNRRLSLQPEGEERNNDVAMVELVAQ